MSGETESSVSGWTVDTLHAHMQRQFDDLRTLLDERHTAQQRAMETALAVAKEAVTKAEEATGERLALLNESKATVADLTAKNITRAEAEAAIDRNTERIQELTDRFNQGEGRLVDPQAFRTLEAQAGQNAGRGAGLNQAWVYLSGLIVLAVAVYGALKP